MTGERKCELTFIDIYFHVHNRILSVLYPGKPGKAKESQEASEDIGHQRNIREVKIDLEDAKDDLQAGKGDLAPTCKGLDPTVD